MSLFLHLLVWSMLHPIDSCVPTASSPAPTILPCQLCEPRLIDVASGVGDSSAVVSGCVQRTLTCTGPPGSTQITYNNGAGLLYDGDVNDGDFFTNEVVSIALECNAAGTAWTWMGLPISRVACAFSPLGLFIFISANLSIKYFGYPSSTELSIDVTTQMHQLSDADRIRGGYSFTELVSECTFAGKTCSSSDFTRFLHPEYGVCYTFTKDFNVTKAGSTQGLRMLMTVNAETPQFTSFDFLPTSDSTNMFLYTRVAGSVLISNCPSSSQPPKDRGILHQPDDFTDFTNNGFKIAARTQTSIAFRRVTHYRAPAPYDECTAEGEMGENDYYANNTYTYKSCQNSCLQRLAFLTCGCVDPLYLKADEHAYCSTPADMICLVNLPSLVSTARNLEGHGQICECRPPCVERILDMTLTYGVYPSAKYKVAVGTQPQRGALLDRMGGGRPGVGDDDADDYDNPSTTTAPPTTTTAPSNTSSPVCVPTLLIDKYAHSCRTQYAYFYNNPKFTVIEGWPCLSTKYCKTCIMFVDPATPEWDWPCQYSEYEECEIYNINSTTSFPCT